MAREAREARASAVAVYVASGDVSATNVTFRKNTALGKFGGSGCNGGDDGFQVNGIPTGGSGGDAGNAGNGGTCSGGSIYIADGSILLSGASVAGGTVEGGPANNGCPRDRQPPSRSRPPLEPGRWRTTAPTRSTRSRLRLRPLWQHRGGRIPGKRKCSGLSTQAARLRGAGTQRTAGFLRFASLELRCMRRFPPSRGASSRRHSFAIRSRIPIITGDFRDGTPFAGQFRHPHNGASYRASGEAEGLAMPVPLATYRVQLHAGFGFDDAAAIAGYLHALGISHLYSSPYLQAGKGSTHGYDVLNHHQVEQGAGRPRRARPALRVPGQEPAGVHPRHRPQPHEHRQPRERLVVGRPRERPSRAATPATSTSTGSRPRPSSATRC